MSNKITAPSQGDGASSQSLPEPAPPATADDSSAQSESHPQCQFRGGNKVYKSGPLFLSSRGIGWTSWKKRWFILTSTSLVFFRSDPNAISQKGTEVNLTLGGIDLNSSGSVEVKADKKLLTVLFLAGNDGRTFTLKAETLEDLYEWKTALEDALKNAPRATPVMEENNIDNNNQIDRTDGSSEQSKDKQPAKSFVIGGPILLALENSDGTPSFLEKALRFVEVHGVKVEGILRQAADVEDVKCRIREYEEGKCEFASEEDPHVIADCVKYVLRELPSSPVPTSCCNALLEACRTDRSMRVTAVRTAICETFPEPNCRLLKRILMMMQTVTSYKSANRMGTSAVAACMAPLLLRPLLAGECDIGHNFDKVGDGSAQLIQAAAAANHAQAIVIILLEAYKNIFGEEEEQVTSGLYTDTEDESEGEYTDNDESFEDDEDYDESDESEGDADEELEHTPSGSEIDDIEDNNLYKGSECLSVTSPEMPVVDRTHEVNQKTSSIPQDSISENDLEISGNYQNHGSSSRTFQVNEFKRHGDIAPIDELVMRDPSACTEENLTLLNGPVSISMRVIDRGEYVKNLSLGSIGLTSEDEAEVQRLEATKTDLQNRISEEAKGNAVLQENLEKHKYALLERRLALEKDIALLQEQLQKEQDLRKALETGLATPQKSLCASTILDEKIKADLEEIVQAEADIINLKQKADGLKVQLNQVHERNYGSPNVSFNQTHQAASLASENPTRNKVDYSTTSALSKISNRLHFLKERRSQIASELQNMEKNQNCSQNFQNLEKEPENHPSLQFEGPEVQSSEGGEISDTSKSYQKLHKGRASKGTAVSSSGRTISESLSDVD